MNKFEKEFFKKYIRGQDEVLGVIHRHFVVIIDKIAINLIFGFLLPAFLVYNSISIRLFIPFYVFEIFFFLVFLKLLYEVFNWYNDVWIVTNSGIVSLRWDIFSTDSLSVKYESIEGLEVIQDGIMDTFLKRGRIILHKLGNDEIVMEDSFLPYDALNEIDKHIKENTNEDDDENPEEKDKFDLLLHTLSGIVEDYMGAKGYEKKHKIAEEDLLEIEKIKKKSGTIDLSK